MTRTARCFRRFGRLCPAFTSPPGMIIVSPVHPQVISMCGAEIKYCSVSQLIPRYCARAVVAICSASDVTDVAELTFLLVSLK